MAVMKLRALREPKERWLTNLILLFISSTAPLERRSLVQATMPSRFRCENRFRAIAVRAEISGRPVNGVFEPIQN